MLSEENIPDALEGSSISILKEKEKVVVPYAYPILNNRQWTEDGI
jgi:hypothetical protein